MFTYLPSCPPPLDRQEHKVGTSLTQSPSGCSLDCLPLKLHNLHLQVSAKISILVTFWYSFLTPKSNYTLYLCCSASCQRPHVSYPCLVIVVLVFAIKLINLSVVSAWSLRLVLSHVLASRPLWHFLCFAIQHVTSLLHEGLTIGTLAPVHCQLFHFSQIWPTLPILMQLSAPSFECHYT